MTITSHGPAARRSPVQDALGAAFVLLLCAAVSGCATTAPAAVPASAASEEPPPLFTGVTGDVVDAGTYVVSGFDIPFEITLDDGWTQYEDFALIKDDAVFVSFWSPTHTPAEACDWNGTFQQIEPDADAFLDALVRQTSTSVSDPRGTMVSGYVGWEVEVALEPGIDPADCTRDIACLHSQGSGSCGRYFAHATEQDTIRILDLDGELAILTVGQFHDPGEELRADAWRVFDSIAFQTPSDETGDDEAPARTRTLRPV